MTRLFHICILLAALLGLTGQSTATAMMPAPTSIGSAQVSMAMDCMDMANNPTPQKSPCKKMTLQCMVAMGCASTALIEPTTLGVVARAVGGMKTAPPLLARLWGRSYGPEPDPPSLLI
ncbi:MAG: hypothetical protein ABIT68_10565 [Sphingomicrobium sp.]